jgi:hypothetical protein
MGGILMFTTEQLARAAKAVSREEWNQHATGRQSIASLICTALQATNEPTEQQADGSGSSLQPDCVQHELLDDAARCTLCGDAFLKSGSHLCSFDSLKRNLLLAREAACNSGNERDKANAELESAVARVLYMTQKYNALATKSAECKWIPAAERLPEMGQEVLISARLATYGLAISKRDLGRRAVAAKRTLLPSGGWTWTPVCGEVSNVTYWMLLPELPK